MTNRVVDSWAWIEYLRGTEKGQHLKKEIEAGSKLFTHSVTVAEIISKTKRDAGDTETAWHALLSLSKIIETDAEFAKEVGLLHADIKSKRPNFSLSDAFSLFAARKYGAKVLTGDPDFKGLPEAEFIN